MHINSKDICKSKHIQMCVYNAILYDIVSHVSYGVNKKGTELLCRGDPPDYGVQSH